MGCARAHVVLARCEDRRRNVEREREKSPKCLSLSRNLLILTHCFVIHHIFGYILFFPLFRAVFFFFRMVGSSKSSDNVKNRNTYTFSSHYAELETKMKSTAIIIKSTVSVSCSLSVSVSVSGAAAVKSSKSDEENQNELFTRLMEFRYCTKLHRRWLGGDGVRCMSAIL